jgi:hypothetical protein
VLGSAVAYAAGVIHLGSKRGSGLLGAACAAKGAGLHGGVRVEFRRRRGSGSVLGMGRSFSGGSWRLWCNRAARARWRRGCYAAEQSSGVARV